jgi:hypothetical protein
MSFVLSTVVRAFRIEPAPGTTVAPFPRVALRPEPGAFVTLVPRSRGAPGGGDFV